MSVQGERLLAAIEAEIKKISKLEHTLARTKIVLQEQASRLRLGTNPELVMTSLRLTVPLEKPLVAKSKSHERAVMVPAAVAVFARSRSSKWAAAESAASEPSLIEQGPLT